MGIRIDDLVAPEAKAELTAFLATMESVKSKYVDICQSMVQGINVKVSVVGDVEKLDELIKVQSREMVTATNQMQTASNQLQTALGNTTNTISRQLAEQEKLNKTQREAYQLNQSALDIAKNILGTYDQNVAALARLNKEMKDNKDAYKNSTITADEFLRKELELKTAKAEVQRILNNETKMMQAADGSYKQLSLQLERMKMAYKQLNEEEKRAGQGKTLGAEIQKLDAHLKDAAADMGEFQRNVGNYAIAAMRAVGVNGKLGSSFASLVADSSNGGNALTGLTTKVKAFGQTAMALLSNPYMLAFLGIAGVVAGAKWWYDYNKGLVEASRQTKFFTGLTGEAMAAVRDKAQAVADTYGKDFADTLKAATAISHNMGVTADEALDLINKGFAAGGENSQQYLNILQRFAPTMEKMGLSADEFVAFAGQIEKAGADTNKSMTAMGKASMQLRTMNKGTADSLNAIGINAKQMSADIQTGKKGAIDAMQEIAQKLQETGTNSREAAAVMKDLFGARGESQIGTEFLAFLADAKSGTEELLGAENSLERLKVKEVETQTELNNVVASLFDMGEGGFETMTKKAKIWIQEGLIKAIKWVVNLINYFIDWYNESMLVRSVIASIFTTVKVGWEILKAAFNLIIDAVKNVGRQMRGLGDIIQGVMTFDVDKIKQGWNEITSSVGKYVRESLGDIRSAGANMGQAFADGFNQTARGHLNFLDTNSVGGANTADGYGGMAGSGGTVSNPTAPDSGSNKSNSAAEKAAKEAMKVLEQLQEAEVAMMEDGLEKTLATIRLAYKKKIDAIKGDSVKEKQLRIALIQQMENDIAKATREYEINRAKIDLENRLATLKQGSKEELDIRLMQLEAQRAAELEAAKKTGADITLIESKFAKQREELWEAYHKAVLDQLAETSATDQVIRDNQLKMELNALNEQMAEELRLVGDNEEKIAAIKEKYANLTAEKQEQYAIDSAKAQLEAYRDMINTIRGDDTAFDALFDDLQDIETNTALLEGMGMAHAEALNMAKQLATAQIDIANAEADAEIAAIERVNEADQKARDRRIANAEKWLGAAQEAIGNITDLVGTLFDGQIAKIEEQQEANQAQYDEQIANIEALAERGAITQEEAELRKREAEAATAKREEELAKKKAQAEYKRAVGEKANSIAQIGIATALGIMKASPNWVNMALVAAMGAIQLATAIAQPIKAYKAGTDYHPGGLAIVGDGGKREVVETGGKYWLTPKVPTLVEMPQGSKVFPDYLDFIANEAPVNYGDLIASMPLPDISPLLFGKGQRVVVNNDFRALQRDVRDLGRMVKMLSKQQHRDASRAKYDRLRQDRL
jgi:hypothetical protein